MPIQEKHQRTHTFLYCAGAGLITTVYYWVQIRIVVYASSWSRQSPRNEACTYAFKLDEQISLQIWRIPNVQQQIVGTFALVRLLQGDARR
jgi:hypothetical protein